DRGYRSFLKRRGLAPDPDEGTPPAPAESASPEPRAPRRVRPRRRLSGVVELGASEILSEHAKGMTQGQVASLIGVCTARIQQIERIALRKCLTRCRAWLREEEQGKR